MQSTAVGKMIGLLSFGDDKNQKKQKKKTEQLERTFCSAVAPETAARPLCRT